VLLGSKIELPDEDLVRRLTRELDKAVPEKGTVRLRYDEDENVTIVRASQLGYLRLGVEFLEAAFDPKLEGDLVELDLEYLTGVEAPCYWFERIEDVDNTLTFWQAFGGGAGALLAISAFLFFIASVIVGALSIIGWVIEALFY
jgi:hypothetical protein